MFVTNKKSSTELKECLCALLYCSTRAAHIPYFMHIAPKPCTLLSKTVHAAVLYACSASRPHHVHAQSRAHCSYALRPSAHAQRARLCALYSTRYNRGTFSMRIPLKILCAHCSIFEFRSKSFSTKPNFRSSEIPNFQLNETRKIQIYRK